MLLNVLFLVVRHELKWQSSFLQMEVLESISIYKAFSLCVLFPEDANSHNSIKKQDGSSGTAIGPVLIAHS